MSSKYILDQAINNLQLSNITKKPLDQDKFTNLFELIKNMGKAVILKKRKILMNQI